MDCCIIHLNIHRSGVTVIDVLIQEENLASFFFFFFFFSLRIVPISNEFERVELAGRGQRMSSNLAPF